MKDITRKNIWKENEYTYRAAYGFMPNMRFYLHEDAEVRPFMLVVPGGGYCMCVPPEAEVVAKEFYGRGMNCAVLTYTTDITMCVPLMRQPLNDISRAVRLIRKDAAALCADPEKIVICGFSAGAHVCGSLGVHYQDVQDPDAELNEVSNRPDAMVLSYPVITSGEYTHIYSMWALLGQNGPKEEYEYFSLEKHVSPETPPTFIWQTVTDDLVPVENSAMFAQACRKAGVPFAYYAFPRGFHGLSVFNEAWRKGDFGEPYTMEQVDLAVTAVREGRGVDVPQQRFNELMEQFPAPADKADAADGSAGKSSEAAESPAPAMPPLPNLEDVSLWPVLFENWFQNLG